MAGSSAGPSASSAFESALGKDPVSSNVAKSKSSKKQDSRFSSGEESSGSSKHGAVNNISPNRRSPRSPSLPSIQEEEPTESEGAPASPDDRFLSDVNYSLAKVRRLHQNYRQRANAADREKRQWDEDTIGGDDEDIVILRTKDYSREADKIYGQIYQLLAARQTLPEGLTEEPKATYYKTIGKLLIWMFKNSRANHKNGENVLEYSPNSPNVVQSLRLLVKWMSFNQDLSVSLSSF